MKTNKKQSGFTIIEVMIVLAIAGLIMMIVFLAVPALRRNSRNTQRRSDVANTLSAIAEFTTNKKGIPPKDAAELATAVTNTKLGVYAAADIKFNAGAPTDTNTVSIEFGKKCNDANAAVTGSTREYAALYKVETGGADQDICQD
jgi:prepilin-type N-terminal cleavage/methylation domain-containing protein